MKLAPVGVFCLIARTFAGLGLDAFLPLLKYMLAVFLALALQGLVVYQVLLKLFTGPSARCVLKKFCSGYGVCLFYGDLNATIPLSIDTLHPEDGREQKISSFHDSAWGPPSIWTARRSCREWRWCLPRRPSISS